MNNEILAGVRVLDFTTIVSGPYCTRLLADLGAEVFKIEPPEGDFIRVQPPLRAGKSAYFASLNCGKKSLAVDLRQPDAPELMRELAAKCDVVVENSRPGRDGSAWDSITRASRRSIRASCTARFPGSGRPAHGRSAAPMLRCSMRPAAST